MAIHCVVRKGDNDQWVVRPVDTAVRAQFTIHPEAEKDEVFLQWHTSLKSIPAVMFFTIFHYAWQFAGTMPSKIAKPAVQRTYLVPVGHAYSGNPLAAFRLGRCGLLHILNPNNRVFPHSHVTKADFWLWSYVASLLASFSWENIPIESDDSWVGDTPFWAVAPNPFRDFDRRIAGRKQLRNERMVEQALVALREMRFIQSFSHSPQNSALDAKGMDFVVTLPDGKTVGPQVKGGDHADARKFNQRRRLLNLEPIPVVHVQPGITPRALMYKVLFTVRPELVPVTFDYQNGIVMVLMKLALLERMSDITTFTFSSSGEEPLDLLTVAGRHGERTVNLQENPSIVGSYASLLVFLRDII